MKFHLSLFILLLLIFSNLSTQAAVDIRPNDEAELSDHQNENLQKEKIASKKKKRKFKTSIKKFFSKFKFQKDKSKSDKPKHPVKKWMWRWLLSWLGVILCFILLGLGILLNINSNSIRGNPLGLIFAIVGGIGGVILFINGLICLIVWLTKLSKAKKLKRQQG